MTLPKPVKRDQHGRRIANYTRREWFSKILEEVLEANETVDLKYHAEELADVITVCISRLEILGFDEEARSELFARVNEKNAARGYFME